MLSPALARENFIGWTRYGVGSAGVSAHLDSLVALHSDWGSDSNLQVKQGIERIRAINPNFKNLIYNSLTDNYDNNLSPGFEQAIIDSICAGHGWNPEEAYIHFYDESMIDHTDYTTNPPTHHYYIVPGCGPGGPTRESRIPINPKLAQNDPQSRKVTNFSTVTAASLQKRVLLNMSVDRHYYDNANHWSNLYPDGIFADNTSTVYYGFGGGDYTFVYGGHVWETAPGNPSNMILMGTNPYDDWHWEHNVGPFLAALRDTLENAVYWHPDHQRKYLAINCGPFTDPKLVTEHSADFPFHEFEANPIRTWWPPIETVRRMQNDLQAAGMADVYAPQPTTSYGGYSITWDEAYEGALAYYLLVRSDDTKFHYQLAGNSPGSAGWDTMSWHPAADVVRAQLGFFRGEPYTIASGSDPLGQPYKVWVREYDNGLVLVRKRESYDQVISPNTAVTVSLPRPLHRLEADGSIGDPITSISVGNGRGMLFLNSISPPRR